MLETLVNDIIDIERLQSGRPIELEKTTVDLAALTANVSATMLEQATQKGILLQQALSDAPILVEGDSNKLLRVVLNLLSNGIKYSERGGQVEIKLTQDRVNAHLTVADQGYGISAEQLPHIFEPYFRADEHRQRAEGNGYGLAIVKAYVEAHAGTVNVRSQPGEGSTFTVSFPLQKVLKK
jgi:two-component system phosphate regulon sensor histidine kinase PhoR